METKSTSLNPNSNNPTAADGAPMGNVSSKRLGIAGKVAQAFVASKLTPLFIIASVLLGLAAVIFLPREEEPQIKVPMIDVIVSLPGFSPKEVEERATIPMEKLLWEVPGVDYVYSMSQPNQSIVIVRFKVGEELEQSLVKLNQKLESNFDRIPPGVSRPLIKPRTIDDVPILALTFHSQNYDHLILRRLVSELENALKSVPNVAETTIIGGARRQVRALLDAEQLAARGLSVASLVPMIQQANRQYRSGSVVTDNLSIQVETGGFLADVDDVKNIVVGVAQGRPIYLRDVAQVRDDAEESSQYVLFGSEGHEEAAVTLSFAKRPGTNATFVAEAILSKLDRLRGVAVPADVAVTVTRNYGETAAEKSNELLWHMAIAVISVSLLILFVLGWRESLVVAAAIPTTLSLTLLVFYLGGFTLNRITLFALIFSIGILVDDAIVVVENIVRHRRLPTSASRAWSAIATEAVAEVGNPTILATFAVIAAVLPMAFVGGLMGPYMRPIPIGASAAMGFSLLVAFIVTPWASTKILGGGKFGGAHPEHTVEAEDKFTNWYRHWMAWLLHQKRNRMVFLLAISALLLLAMALVPAGLVRVKMLPFDNKSEFQIILNMPESSSLELTTNVAREIARAVSEEKEVTDYQVYAGTAAPFNFNGLVRHYFLRRGPAVADIQVNLVARGDRSRQSHEIAKAVRPRVVEIAKRYQARVAVAEVPPGPPVLQTLVAEIYGPSEEARYDLAAQVRTLMQSTDEVVDVDWYAEDQQPRARFVVDKEKAALHGISAETVAQTLRIALAGDAVGIVHKPSEREDLAIVLQLPQSARVSPDELLSLMVRSGDANALPEPSRGEVGASAPLVSLRELVKVEYSNLERTIYHKNLQPVVYVTGDVAGKTESPAYAIFDLIDQIKAKLGKSTVQFYHAQQPQNTQQLSIKWDGEWHITLEVFRDMGAAFAVVLVLIYVLMVGWFASFLTPVVVMAAIPFSLVGILPAHAAMGAFFTATSMIGFMAGAGIVVRNSIILVDFIELRLSEGMPLEQAVVDAGAVRFRPMLLTAMAVVVGASVILFDPIFQGLAISLMAGEVASLLISRMAVPVLYFWSREWGL